MTDQNPTPAPQPPPPQTVVNVTMANTNQARAEAIAEAAAVAADGDALPHTSKSTRTAYLLLVLGGVFGLHRIYLGRRFVLWLLFLWFLAAAPFGPASLFSVLGVALLFLGIDALCIPAWVQMHNNARPPRVQPGPAPVIVERSSLPAALASPTGIAHETPKPEPRPPPGDLQTSLLHAAHRGDGKLTVTQAVMETGETFKKVEACLKNMVRTGYVDVDNEPESGVIVYAFPELVGRPIHRDPQPRQEIAE